MRLINRRLVNASVPACVFPPRPNTDVGFQIVLNEPGLFA